MKSQHFLIYKTTNLINGKIYIGKHVARCIDDGYMGSGKLLKRAISKYGMENFVREILHECSSEEEMNAKEAEIVTEEFCNLDTNYNLCVGGQGGFSYINREILTPDRRHNYGVVSLSRRNSKYKDDTDHFKNAALKANETKMSRYGYMTPSNRTKNTSFKGRKHSEETRRLKSQISKERGLQSGEKNSQFGSMWITNGEEKKKIKNTDSIPEGWRRGRK